MFYRLILKELQKWAAKTGRKPLVLRGARQVGKTTVVSHLAEDFSQYIYLNLEMLEDSRLFINTQDIHTLAQAIFFTKNKRFEQRHDTLVFIDEIQAVPTALNMLRYFYELYPEIRVIAAGSLLESMFTRNLTYPVGRIEYMVIRPVSFPEFLQATGEDLALEQLHNIPVNDFAHDRLMKLYHTYALIGGMPEIIAKYAETKNLTVLAPIYESLINTYSDDVDKYSRSDVNARILRHCIRAIFFEAGKRIKFQNFANSNYSSREVGDALRTLEKTFLLNLLYPTSAATLPLVPDLRKSPRLQVLDTGLMNYYLGVQTDILGTDNLTKIHQGLMIEHLVGQEILAPQFNVLSALNFWTREKKTSTAEVDYVYPLESQLYPIEVKSGKDGTLKSLHLYMDESPHNLALRFYGGKFQVTEPITPQGKSYRLLSLPYYLSSQTKGYIEWLRKEGISRPPTAAIQPPPNRR